LAIPVVQYLKMIERCSLHLIYRLAGKGRVVKISCVGRSKGELKYATGWYGGGIAELYSMWRLSSGGCTWHHAPTADEASSQRVSRAIPSCSAN
jgi:hypothetical protein